MIFKKDEIVKSRHSGAGGNPESANPLNRMDSRFRGNDGKGNFQALYETLKRPLKISPFGFTLLEVMIALAILSVVAVAFLRNQAFNIRLGSESIQISLATLLAQEKMAELESLGFPEPGKKTGIKEERTPPLRWEQIVSATEFLNLRKGQVRVLWNEGVQERVFELTAYFSKK